MIDLNNLAAILIAFFIVTVSPGPANLAVATVSMAKGRKSGMLLSLGLSIGLAFWGLIAATGMGAILQTTASALTFLKIAGGLYLLWLAYQSARSAFKPSNVKSETLVNERWFWRGLFLNLSNPKAVVAWMAALSMGLGTGDGAMMVTAATFLCVILGLLNYMGYTLLFSQRGMMAGYNRLKRWIDGTVAALFAVAGFGLLRSAFSRT